MDKAEKAFGIGLGRTGSLSLSKAMKILGYKSKHAIRTLKEIWQYDFINDIGVSGRYKFLDYYFPHAKFILTTRDVESWIESNRRWSADRGGEYSEKKGHMNVNINRAENRFLCYGITHFDEAVFRKIHSIWDSSVIDYFYGKENKLLIMDVCKGDGWDRLCEFLNKPTPNVPFPHTHRSK